MAGWLKFVLISFISILSLWLNTSAAAAVTTDSAADVRSPVQSYGDNQPTGLMIAPELTNPAEIPLAETPSAPPFTWFSEATASANPIESAKPDKSTELETVDTNLEQWLAFVKTFFEGN